MVVGLALSGCTAPYQAPAGGPKARLGVYLGEGVVRIDASIFEDAQRCSGRRSFATVGGLGSGASLGLQAVRGDSPLTLELASLRGTKYCNQLVSFYVRAQRTYQVVASMDDSFCGVTVTETDERSRSAPVRLTARTGKSSQDGNHCTALADAQMPSSSTSAPVAAAGEAKTGVRLEDLRGLIPAKQ